MAFDVDVLIVGSGFGGSVAALRLAQKGYSVVVCEAGARFADEEFPATSFDVKRYLFRPELGCYGIQRIDVLRDCVILSGSGVGGGSLVYANTLYEPLDNFYQDPAWAHIANWRAELAPHYAEAKRMLGVAVNPKMSPADGVMEQIAQQMGVGHTFQLTPVGVFFGEPGIEVGDPYFDGAGPVRRGCHHCGACMTGCRHNAKNTLVKNYLFLAEKAGVKVLPLTTVTGLDPLPEGGYRVVVSATKHRRTHQVLRAHQVVLAASALGTQRLLHRMRDEGRLPKLSPRLGYLSRTNSESLLGAIAPPDTQVDYSTGVAITSSFHPTPQTHVEPVRYGRGSNLMSALQTVLVEGPNGPTPRAWLRELWKMRYELSALYDLKHWSERTVIALVMQSLDNSVTTYTKPFPFSKRRYLTSRQGHGEPNPTWLPVAHEVVRRMATLMGGMPGSSVGEPFGRPLTAHFIGGATIGQTPTEGVIDAYQRVFGHPGLHVFDGAAVTANLGANPSLTIAAQAERAASFWPRKGEPDPRPPLGSPYEAKKLG
jgi:cholesterol oxidase